MQTAARRRGGGAVSDTTMVATMGGCPAVDSLPGCLEVKVQSFRITGRAQFPIGTVPGYMYMKYGYTEFVFGGWTDSENQLSD